MPVIKTRSGVEIKVDTESLAIIAGKTVFLRGKGYPAVSINGGKHYRHRLFTNAPKEMEVDHINGDILDCRLGNLRICTRAENMRNSKIPKNNTSGFRGIVRDRKKWRAMIRVDCKRLHLGMFDTPEEAAAAYDAAAIEHHGEFARTNN